MQSLFILVIIIEREPPQEQLVQYDAYSPYIILIQSGQISRVILQLVALDKNLLR